MSNAVDAVQPRRSIASLALPRAAGIALEWLGVALIVLYVSGIVMRNTTTQWDFRTYWTAATVALSGNDPYVRANLSAAAGRPTEPFVYPLVGLTPFLPWTLLPVTTATLAWVTLKAATLAGLTLLWSRRFLPGAGVLPLALVAVFGWNGAALMDLRSGNVALVEAALLWSGFACLASGRRGWFAGLVVAAACFKVLPAVFLLLLCVPTADRASGRRPLWIAGAVLAGVLVASLAAARFLHWQDFFRHLSPAEGLGAANPSAYALCMRLAPTLGVSGDAAATLGAGLWVVFGAGIVAAGVPLLRRAVRAGDVTTVIMASVFLYVLIAPRVMAYGFVLLAPVPLFFSPPPFRGAAGRLALALLLAAQGLGQAAHHQDSSIVYVFAPTLLSACLWLLVANASGAHDATGAGAGARAGAGAPVVSTQAFVPASARDRR